MDHIATTVGQPVDIVIPIDHACAVAVGHMAGGTPPHETADTVVAINNTSAVALGHTTTVVPQKKHFPKTVVIPHIVYIILRFL
jgi:hypothetical protein